MDVASPLTARTAGRTPLGFGSFTLFTAARTFIGLATQVTGDRRPAAGRRDRHHPSVPGRGRPSL